MTTYGPRDDGAQETVVTGEAETIDIEEKSPTGDLTSGMLLGGRYELGPVLGAGGAGRVFAAFDRVLNERVALKVLRPDRAGERSWIRRLVREVKIARLIRHPNVCRVFELGREDGHWFITMELAEGGTVRDVLRATGEGGEPRLGQRRRDVPWAQRSDEARALCAGLAAIHAVGIVHRDVTPQNVLVMGDGRLVVSDFGLAIGAQESTTFIGGTPRYMAPEVAAGKRADQRSDVYQLGLVLHELLFGRRAEWHEVGGRQVLSPPIDPDVSTPAQEAMAALSADCLHDDPAARPANAVAVAGRLAAAEKAPPRGPWSRVRRRIGRFGKSPVTRWVAAATILLAIGAQSGRVALRPRLCRGGPAHLATVWGPQTKAALRRAFLASGRASATATFNKVAKIIDD